MKFFHESFCIKQKLLTLIFLLLIIVTLIVLWFHFEKKKFHPKSSQYLVNKTIETSQLPLSLTYIIDLKSLGISGDGGSIGVYRSGILFMDRAGNFYRIAKGKATLLDLHVPNNIAQYKQDFPDRKLHKDVLKSTSFLLDKSSQSLFVAFNKYAGEDSVKLCVAQILFDEKNLEFRKSVDWQMIFCTESIEGQTESTHGSGGKLLIRGSSIYLSVGFPPEENYGKSRKTTLEELLKSSPQDTKSSRGKIIQINLSNKTSKILSLGHRNPQGLTFDAEGYLLNSEHGPQGGDEINLIKDGFNYGYPVFVLGTRYGTYDFSWPAADLGKTIKNMALPIFAFVPSIGISPIIQISDFHQKINGDLLVGSLKAQSLYRLKYVDQRILYSEPIWIGHRIRDIVEYEKSVFLLTDDPYIIELKVDQDKLNMNSTNNDLYYTSKVVQDKCMVCHSFSASNPTSIAPSLSKVYNRKIGGDNNYRHYSLALKSYNGNWNEDNLSEFLKSPDNFVPGTSMPRVNLSNKEIKEVLFILKSN